MASTTRLAAGQHFGAVVSGRRLGVILSKESEYRGGTSLPLHCHDTSYLCLVVHGSFDERAGRAVTSYATGSALYRPADTLHRQRFGASGARCFTLAIPDRLTSSLTSPWRLDARRDYRGTSVAPLLHAARREHLDPDAVSGLRVEGLLLEIVALALRLGRATPAPRAVRRTQELLSTSVIAPPPLAAIASEVGMDPLALARAFKAHVGCGMAEFVRRQRLQSAVRALVGSSRPISTIAAEHGFYDQSHLGRHCRRRFGVSPISIRKAGRAGLVPVHFEAS
jgi:AraC family transcriptional regulator